MRMLYYFLMVFVFLVMGAPAYTQVNDQTGSQEQKKQEEQKHYLYQWTDSKGVVHIADSLSKVPMEYRSEAQRLESPPGAEGTENQPGRQNITSPSDYSEQEERLKDQKEQWQGRMKAAKQRLGDAEQRYRDLAQKRDQLLQSWGGPASGHLAGREEASQIDQQMKQVQQEIDEARNQIEVVIPDEARKAGVPPGWLRE
jgi:uncharacterized protein YukE